MPEFDLYFLPPSVSVTADSMLDDTVAFSLMVAEAAPWAASVPLSTFFHYVLPYASYHESRVNWRPSFFGRFFALVENASSTAEAMNNLVTPFWSPSVSPAFLNWSAHVWPDYPVKPPVSYHLQWASCTSPPNISPFDFATNGYASCTGWATMLTYVARSVGIPARQVGTPCWNSGEFSGLAVDNPNVTQCWAAGNGSVFGGAYLNNHNWVEYFDTNTQDWVFINVPPGTSTPNAGLCSWSAEHGCDWTPTTGCADVTGGAGAAGRDHEILATTWAHPSDQVNNGGEVVDAQAMQLSNGMSMSPLVWSPRLKAPMGRLQKDVGLRFVNRTAFYRCH
jgi:transglutaminase-like putative cysteine protease